VETAYDDGLDRLYALVDHDGHTHLTYVLELPPQPGDAQRVFRIEREASYRIAVRNPDVPAPPGTGLPQRRGRSTPRSCTRASAAADSAPSTGRGYWTTRAPR
jgi:hypothetical protein